MVPTVTLLTKFTSIPILVMVRSITMAVLLTNCTQRRRIEAAEMKLLRLFPLRLQNKRPHTPAHATDHRHTKHDRQIQIKLASTLANNATKPNPFEIIPLQTTEKENDWKTEETLARTAVTQETEWIRGSNH